MKVSPTAVAQLLISTVSPGCSASVQATLALLVESYVPLVAKGAHTASQPELASGLGSGGLGGSGELAATVSVVDTEYHEANDCTTKPDSVTDVAVAAGTKVKLTELFRLGSLCPKPQLPYAVPVDGLLSVPISLALVLSARKPLKSAAPLSVRVTGTFCASGALACARISAGSTNAPAQPHDARRRDSVHTLPYREAIWAASLGGAMASAGPAHKRGRGQRVHQRARKALGGRRTRCSCQAPRRCLLRGAHTALP